MSFKFIDLFAGIGAFHQAMIEVGGQCVMASEIDSNCCKQYELNYGIKPLGDIKEISIEDVPNHDVLCAGFPCQPFSIAGKKQGFEDDRGDLFFWVARIVEEKKPKIVILENVKNIVTHDNGNTFNVIIETLQNFGYRVNHRVLNAVDFELPQKRERVYIIATKEDKEYVYPTPSKNVVVINDILEDDESIQDYVIPDSSIVNLKWIDSKVTSISKPKKIGEIKKGGQGDRIYSPDHVGITISASSGGTGSKTGLYYVNGKIRKLSPRECAKVQGFNDDYVISVSDSQAYKQFGNTIPVNVLREIINSLKEQKFI